MSRRLIVILVAPILAIVFLCLFVFAWNFSPPRGSTQWSGNPAPARTEPPAVLMAATLPPSETPTSTSQPSPTLLSSTLQLFPLQPGTTWTYTYIDYDPDPSDPLKTVQAVFEIDRAVTNVKIGAGTYFAHIQEQVKALNQDPGWLAQGQNPPTNSRFWYIVRGGRVFRGPETVNPESLPEGQLSLEFVFPIAKGAEWCPVPGKSVEKGPQGTLAPCQYAGKRVVLAEMPYPSQAGNFQHCYQTADQYNSGGIVQVVCDGAGIVEVKYDHAGTRFGFSQTLIQIKLPPQ